MVAVVATAVVLVLPACSGDDGDGSAAGPDGSGAGGPGTTEVAPDPVPPEGPGEFAVGHTEVVVTDGDRPGRELPVAVWYPADEVAEGAEPSFYSFVGDVGITSEVSQDDVAPASGPFPLVVFSHGNGGTRVQSTFLAEALASHGFVVASPDHVGNTAAELVTGTGVSQAQSALDRPLDVTAVIDDLVARSADPDDLLADTVDGDAVGVTGHSFGGFTTLASAVETDGVPAEPRVRAIAPIAPASSPIGDEALASITTPILLVGGTLDTTTEIDPEVTRPWGLVGSSERYRVDVEGAGHISFTDLCPVGEAYAARPDAVPLIVAYIDGLAEEGCSEGFTDPGEVHDLTERYVVAFFEVTLAGDDAYRQLLTPTDGVDLQTG